MFATDSQINIIENADKKSVNLWQHSFFLIILFCFLSLNVFAQYPFFELELVRNDSIMPQKKFRKITAFKNEFVNDSTQKRELQNIILRLNDNGYLSARVDSSRKVDSLHLKAWITTGEVFRWATIKAGNVSEDILSRSNFREKVFFGEPIYFRSVTRLQKRIIAWCENNGYPFASVKLDSLKIKEGKLLASLNLKKNGLFTIDSLVIKGNAKVKPVYLYNYYGIKPGDVYDESLVRKISVRTKELAFVRETQAPQAVFSKDKAKLLVFLDKKGASQFDGILGVLPDNATGKVLVTGDLKLNLLNSFGRGETVSINWRKLQAQTQDLRTQVVYPFLFNTPFGVDLKFDLYKRDTTFININMAGGLQYLFSGGNYLKVFIDSRTSNLLSTYNLQNITTLPQYADVKTLLYGIGGKFEKLDYRFNPRKGLRLIANLQAGNKTIRQNAKINPEAYEGIKLKTLQINTDLVAEYYIPLGKRSTVKTGLQGAAVVNQNLFQNELPRIGGLKTLRGFDEESIFASLYSIATLEYRFLLEQNSYLFSFFDQAYYENTSRGKRIFDRPFGFGAGITFETKIGIFSLTYALGKQFDNPVNFRSGKIHFGVVSRF
ncbi:MAG: Outer membrane protein assembly factor BamA [Bacteroidia bacterium]|nr:Outer membrane protein assembly factor BamA [Bacteroidia bacterium]